MEGLPVYLPWEDIVKTGVGLTGVWWERCLHMHGAY